jgi:hypothetical protein
LRGTGVIRRVVMAHGLNHVELDKWVGGPPIQSKIGVAIDFEIAGVIDLPTARKIASGQLLASFSRITAQFE